MPLITGICLMAAVAAAHHEELHGCHRRLGRIKSRAAHNGHLGSQGARQDVPDGARLQKAGVRTVQCSGVGTDEKYAWQ
jgi:hypothetical protein